jgi:hypothetical protein
MSRATAQRKPPLNAFATGFMATGTSPYSFRQFVGAGPCHDFAFGKRCFAFT